MVPIWRRVLFIFSGGMVAFLALNSLFPETWLWIGFPGVFIFEAIRAASILIRSILFIAFLFISSVLITLGAEGEH